MNLTDYLEAKTLEVMGLHNAESPVLKEKELLVNDMRNVVRQRLVEYLTWYGGDSDSLYNLYNLNNMIEYPTEPYYWVNRRSFFWCKSADDRDFKRTHCGFARDMVDTTVLVCGDPVVTMGELSATKQCGLVLSGEALKGIMEANDFLGTYRRKQMPLTLAQGWGAWKITWNVGVYGNDPVLHYYTAENVKVYRRAGRLVGMTFLDWYGEGQRKFLVAETRVRKGKSCLMRTEYFSSVDGGDNLTPMVGEEAREVLGLGGDWDDMPCLFAEPCSFYEDPLHNCEGKSILEGKLSLLDDLDQAFSIASNAVRRSAPIETYDVDYCERDPQTMEPKLPKTFERKYITVSGQRNSFGEKDSSKPIDVVQPQLNLQIYDEHILSLERTIINGHLSPATLGLDVDKKDHAKDDSVRDISVTLFTRNHLKKAEGRILRSILQQALVAKEFLATGKVTVLPDDWDVKVEFDEFSDKSYESKLESLSGVLVNDGISPEMYVRKVYGGELSDKERENEIAWISENHKNRAQDAGNIDGQMGAMDAEMGLGDESGKELE